MFKYYKVILYVEVGENPVRITEEDVAGHCVDAAQSWGGQFHPDHPLCSSNLDVVGGAYQRLARRPRMFDVPPIEAD